jgi:hypothetical protein
MTRRGKSKPTNVVAIWLTAAQRQAAKEMAKCEGYTTVNAWIKSLVLAELACESPHRIRFEESRLDQDQGP